MEKVLLQFIIVFLIIFLIYYFFVIRKCKGNNGYAPVEVNIILSRYNIDIKKIDLYKMIKQVSLVTTFILSIAITIITNLFDNIIISILFATLLSVIIAFILYGFIGKHYEKKSKTSKK